MTEQEYVDSTDLVKIVIMKNLMHDITPENSKAIDPDEHKEVMVKLCEWERKLRHQIKVR